MTGHGIDSAGRPRNALIWIGATLMAASFGAGYIAGRQAPPSVPEVSTELRTDSPAPGVTAPPLSPDQLNGASLPPGHPEIDPSATAEVTP
jgi:hypothetical protein